MHLMKYTSLVLYESFLNVGSISELQKATGLRVITLSDTGQGQKLVYRPGVAAR